MELQITQTRHPLSILEGKNVYVQHPSKMENYSLNVHKIRGAHLRYLNNHYTKFERKGMITFGVTDYTNLVPLKCCRRTDRQTDGRTGGVDPLLDLLSLNRCR